MKLRGRIIHKSENKALVILQGRKNVFSEWETISHTRWFLTDCECEVEWKHSTPRRCLIFLEDRLNSSFEIYPREEIVDL